MRVGGRSQADLKSWSVLWIFVFVFVVYWELDLWSETLYQSVVKNGVHFVWCCIFVWITCMGLDTPHQHLGHCTLHMYLSVSNCICLCFNLYLCVWCTLAGLGSDTPHQSVGHNGAQFRPQSPNCIWPRTDLTGSAHQVGSAHSASQLHIINGNAHQRPCTQSIM